MLEEKPLWTRDYEGPEPGATNEDLRVYTYLGGNEYKYWGVRSLDETLEEFWARNDPAYTREHITANNPRPLPAPARPTSSKSPSPPPHAGSRSRRRAKAPEFNLKHRVAKPTIVSPASKKGIQKTLASKVEGRSQEIFEQSRVPADNSTKEPTFPMNPWGTGRPDEAERPQTISGVNSSMSTPSSTQKAARGRPRKIHPIITDSSPPKTADWLTSKAEDPSKRERGRPAKEKYPTKSPNSHRSNMSNEEHQGPVSESKAKVTKSKSKNERPIAPSVHTMRTRAKGPAENLPRF